MHTKFSLTLIAGLMTTLASSTAHAENIGSNMQGYTGVNRGVFQLGLENTLLFSYSKTPIVNQKDSFQSASSLNYLGGISPRYFVMNNLAVGASLNLFVQSKSTTLSLKDTTGKVQESEASALDLGFLGLGTAAYYLRVGNGAFLVPEVGVGGFVGTRRKPIEGQPNVESKSSISGVAGRAGLGLVYYASPRFWFKGGLDVLLRAGKEKPDSLSGTNGNTGTPTISTTDGDSFTTVDAGFNIGLGYSF